MAKLFGLPAEWAVGLILTGSAPGAMVVSVIEMVIVPLLAGLILNIYGMTVGYGVGSVFQMENRRRRTLAIEIGMQNAGLGTVLALKHFGERATIPAAIFVFICIITASIIAEVWQRRKAKVVE